MVYLGTIIVPAVDGTNNLTSGAPFAIPHVYPRILLVTPAQGIDGFNVRVGVGSSLVATTDDFSISGEVAAQFDLPVSSDDLVVALYAAGAGGSVRVFGLYGSSPATG